LFAEGDVNVGRFGILKGRALHFIDVTFRHQPIILSGDITGHRLDAPL
jgi:hypothetical protein